MTNKGASGIKHFPLRAEILYLKKAITVIGIELTSGNVILLA